MLLVRGSQIYRALTTYRQRARPVTPLTDGHAKCPHCGQEVEIAAVLMIPNAASF